MGRIDANENRQSFAIKMGLVYNPAHTVDYIFSCLFFYSFDHYTCNNRLWHASSAALCLQMQVEAQLMRSDRETRYVS